jgi:hypothetical protein
MDMTWTNRIPILSPWTNPVTFWLTWSNRIPIVSLLAPVGHILVDVVKLDPNVVPPGPSWSHFG